MPFHRSSTFGDALDSPAARAVLETFLPGVAASPMALQYRGVRLGQLVGLVPQLEEPEARERLWTALADVEDGDEAPRAHPPAVDPDPAYEGEDVRHASAPASVSSPVPRWGVVEVRLDGPSHGNPFVDVELDAVFRRGGRELRAGGFYDGDGAWIVRLLADEEGEWTFETRSTARSLDGVTGAFSVTAAEEGAHGPVRVDGFHFRHADGTRYRPVGTTAYAWTHQPEALQEQTLATLEGSPFTKVRMCLFPKSYLYNGNEPEDFPFPGSAASGFDLERFDPSHFRRLEKRIRQLGERGVEADLILFHAYDRWGFADLGPAVDDRVLRYVVRRLSAFANVWWALANEYDLLWAKTEEDWERFARIVVEEDPHGHLRSIHNCRPFYDQTRPWVTHASVQRQDVYRTAEFTDEWRARWGKPVVIDEVGYEGDIDQGWGSLTAEELVRRSWEGAVRGGYVAHGETYLADDEVLWWSKGGVLKGSSPERLAFLDGILAEAPEGAIDPLPSDWDVPWGGVAERYLIGYFGFNRPRFRNLVLPGDGEWHVDVIDTWNMTVERRPGLHRGTYRVELPGRQYIAVRLVAA
ncbi:DUF5605 domain-containing protein [Microbacterium betulae]|uniref:DUF5605 domain-containing protein n=1 Tax=Microbacterium betulae TaxID=2981139 RepID=A0AA97FJS7_9MICO|nr:DUF5605 domain-containing protein [Microbacterium sp. AB]WOF24281.1 DUF5605 domain-containing protein [Microbacterium sp. AB]